MSWQRKPVPPGRQYAAMLGSFAVFTGAKAACEAWASEHPDYVGVPAPDVADPRDLAPAPRAARVSRRTMGSTRLYAAVLGGTAVFTGPEDACQAWADRHPVTGYVVAIAPTVAPHKHKPAQPAAGSRDASPAVPFVRTCRCCGCPIARDGASGNQPTWCKVCQDGRRADAAAERMRRKRQAARLAASATNQAETEAEVTPALRSLLTRYDAIMDLMGAGTAGGSALIWDGQRGTKRRPRTNDDDRREWNRATRHNDRYDAVRDALGATDAGQLPLVDLRRRVAPPVRIKKPPAVEPLTRYRETDAITYDEYQALDVAGLITRGDYLDYIERHGKVRDIQPSGWSSNRGPANRTRSGAPVAESTLNPNNPNQSDLWGLIYGRGGLVSEAMRHDWLKAHPNWWPKKTDPDEPSIEACSHKQIEEEGAA